MRRHINHGIAFFIKSVSLYFVPRYITISEDATLRMPSTVVMPQMDHPFYSIPTTTSKGKQKDSSCFKLISISLWKIKDTNHIGREACSYSGFLLIPSNLKNVSFALEALNVSSFHYIPNIQLPCKRSACKEIT